MLRALGTLVAASALVLSATATAAAPATPKPTLVELEGKPSGYALGVTPLDRPDVCGAKKVRMQVGTNMALSLATWLSTPAQQGPSPTVSVVLPGGAQKVTFAGAKAIGVELPTLGPQSNGPGVFVVEVETQSTTCSALTANGALALDNQAAALAARATSPSAGRTRLDGKPLDEATFHSLLKEDVKFFSREFEQLPTMRTPAVLLFAADEPLSVHLRDGVVLITLRLQGYALGSDVNFKAPRTVTLRYRPVVDVRGMRLVRDQESYLKDAAWKKVLDRFLPAELTPVARFENANLKSRLELRRLVIADGWLASGATRVVVAAPAAQNLAKD